MSDDEDVTFMTTADRQSSDKVRAWANVMKLTEATADAILELGFNSMEALSLIEADDLIETNIPIGQKKLLLKAVKKTFPHEINGEFAETASTSRACAQRGDVEFQDGEFGNASGGNKDGGSSGTNKDGGFRGPNKDGGAHGTNKDGGSPEDHYIQAVLKQLAYQKQQELSPVAVNPSDNSMNNLGINFSISWQDPQIYLKSSNIDCKINFYDISDFVSYDIGGTSMPEERLISDSSGGQLVFKSGPSVYLRPKAMYTKPQASGPAKFASKQQDNVKYTSHSAEGVWGPSSILCPSKKPGIKVKPVRDLDFNVWQEELKNDFDKDFLLHGIKNGFDIVQNDLALINISAKNHPSALPSSPLYEKAHQQILTEIENGNYEFTESTPKIISHLGVIPKPDGGVRIIHDCSRPLGSAVNDFAEDMEKQKFQSVDDAAKLVTKNFSWLKSI
ncbi:unnamed protein product [Mytilus coruscus]|uniref:Uncharacterized protein n=1 Tax=Mytilus coruscus TaxID=42192 RepID=A0A6J8D9I7_MYTCO|nr:unnamed protein product [Mytilus coruscus]